MKTIAEIAHDAILATNLVTEDRIAVGEIDYHDWDGLPRVVVIEEESAPPEEYQFGPIAQTTPLVLRCCAETREETIKLCNRIAVAVLQTLERMEHDKNSGVLAVTRGGNGSDATTDGNGFEASRQFNVLNRINL